MKVAILQSNYIPWKGYFDMIAKVDLFVFHDDLQYTKNDWRNRNVIQTPAGLKWLTIPVGSSEKRLICEVQIKDHSWQNDHWNQILANYGKAPYFAEFKEYFRSIYKDHIWTNLSELNQYLIKDISNRFLNIHTPFDDSRNYHLQSRKAERVLELLKAVGATHYVSGPAAKDYLNEEMFIQEGIVLEWMDYSNYPEYPQLYAPFVNAVSIIDLLFNMGSSARQYLKCNT